MGTRWECLHWMLVPCHGRRVSPSLHGRSRRKDIAMWLLWLAKNATSSLCLYVFIGTECQTLLCTQTFGWTIYNDVKTTSLARWGVIPERVYFRLAKHLSSGRPDTSHSALHGSPHCSYFTWCIPDPGCTNPWVSKHSIQHTHTQLRWSQVAHKITIEVISVDCICYMFYNWHLKSFEQNSRGSETDPCNRVELSLVSLLNGKLWSLHWTSNGSQLSKVWDGWRGRWTKFQTSTTSVCFSTFCVPRHVRRIRAPRSRIWDRTLILETVWEFDWTGNSLCLLLPCITFTHFHFPVHSCPHLHAVFAFLLWNSCSTWRLVYPCP